MIQVVRKTGAFSLSVLASLGRACILFFQLLLSLPAAIRRYELLIEQCYRIGVLTLPIILVSSLFVGMVLALQGYNTLVDFGAESSLGLLIALSLTRELGPVLAGLLFAGRAGAAVTAEIGLMKATDQLAGMEMMAVDPLWRVLAPRFLAGVLSVPLLAVLFTASGIVGGYFLGVELVSDRDTKQAFNPALRLTEVIRHRTLEAGLICYPVSGTIDGVNGDVVIIAPPYNASSGELEEIAEKLAGGLQLALADIKAA